MRTGTRFVLTLYSLLILLSVANAGQIIKRTPLRLETGVDISIGMTMGLDYNVSSYDYDTGEYFSQHKILEQLFPAVRVSASWLLGVNEHIKLGGEVGLNHLGTYRMQQYDEWGWPTTIYYTNKVPVQYLSTMSLVKAQAGHFFFMLGAGVNFVDIIPRFSYCAVLGGTFSRGSLRLPVYIRLDQILANGWFWGDDLGAPITVGIGLSLHYEQDDD